jgi:hypothetical protein
VTRLTTERRKELPSQEFALPGGRYPINDENHGRSALSMAHYASPAEQAEIKRKVHAKFPGIGSK